MDVFGIFECALRKIVGIPMSRDPYQYDAYRKYLMLASMYDEEESMKVAG